MKRKPRKRAYSQIFDGEGFELTSGAIHRLACCDCGLVHDLVLVSHDHKKIGVAMKRNKRATAQKRRWLK